jgi:hypothetical protein
MSELEIHTMRNRLEKGRLHKAQRGELFLEPPVGYVKTVAGKLTLDPDEQVRSVVTLVFDKFDELGGVCAVLRYLLRHGIRMGIRAAAGPDRGRLEWRRPCRQTIYKILHHPFYSGTYAYGRWTIDPKRRQPDRRGTGRKALPMEQWKVVLHDRVPAYITRERYLHNQERLLQNRSRFDAPGTARMGVALLAGIVFCGRCGTRLRACYSRSQKPRYECRRDNQHKREPTCHGIAAPALDALAVEQVLRALEPAALELSLRAGEDVQRERERLTLHRRQQLERSHYESVKAERSYRAVDPENRLVARTLEQQWEQSLRQEQHLREEYDRFLLQTPSELTAQERDRIRALSTDIPSLWNAAATTAADRKEIIRCLLDRVAVLVQGDTEHVDVSLHWVGGFVSQHQIRRRVGSYEQLRDFDRLVERARQLHEAGHNAVQIAEQLNQEGFKRVARSSGFDGRTVRQLLPLWGLGAGRCDEVLLGEGERRLGPLSRKLRVHESKLRRWVWNGWVHCRRAPVFGFWVIWADRGEMKRLRRLRDHAAKHPNRPYPKEITTLGRRPDVHTNLHDPGSR